MHFNRDWLLHLGLALIGLSLPALLSGKAVLGGCLGLGAIVILACLKRSDAIQFKDLLWGSPLFSLSIVAFVCVSLSVFVSLKPETSLTTLLRWPTIPFLVILCFIIARKQFSTFVFFLFGGLLLASWLGMAAFWFEPAILAFIKAREDMTIFSVYTSLKPISNCFLLALPLVIYYGLYKPGWRIFSAVLSITIITNIFVFDAKAALAGLLIMLGVCGLLLTVTYASRKLFVFLSSVFIALGLYAVNWLKSLTSGVGLNNQHLVSLPVWLIDFHRQSIWNFSLSKFTEAPWLGYGVNASNYMEGSNMTIREFYGEAYQPIENISYKIFPSHPHNWPLEFLLDAGLVGFLPFFGLVMMIFYLNIKSYLRTRDPVLMVILGVNAVFWGSGLFNFSYWSAWWQASYAVIIAACLILYKFPPTPPVRKV